MKASIIYSLVIVSLVTTANDQKAIILEIVGPVFKRCFCLARVMMTIINPYPVIYTIPRNYYRGCYQSKTLSIGIAIQSNSLARHLYFDKRARSIESEKMLTTAELKTIQHYLKIYCSSHVVPFDYNPVDISESLRGTTSRTKLIFTTIAIVVTAIILGHELFILTQYLDPGISVSPETFCMHVLLIGWRLLVILAHVNNVIYKEEIALLYNQVVNFNVDAFDGNFMADESLLVKYQRFSRLTCL